MPPNIPPIPAIEAIAEIAVLAVSMSSVPLKEDGKPVIIPGNPITDEERAQFIANARELYQDQGRVRQLIDELRAAFNSIR